MDEFGLIETFFTPLSSQEDDVLLGVGDDAALLLPPKDHLIAVSTDSLVLNQHFLEDWDPYAIGYKALACNISDMAAMGALPRWVSLALTLPKIDEPWLKGFSKGLSAQLNMFSLALVGGDITKGPLQITITIQGVVPKGRAITRSQAKSGDKIYVTGALGEAAYAVTQLDSKDYQSPIFKKLFFPTARVAHGIELREYASSAIDISDGLCADLGHILTQSQIGAVLFTDSIPCALSGRLNKEQALDYALSGGDEYELCFTVPKDKVTEMGHLLDKKRLPYYCIGEIIDAKGLYLEEKEGKRRLIDTEQGFKHF